MAKLADAHGSGPCGVKSMQVQLLLSAPNIGVSPSGKASDSDSDIRGFKSFHPSHIAKAMAFLTQLV